MVIRNSLKLLLKQQLIEPYLDETENDISELTNYDPEKRSSSTHSKDFTDNEMNKPLKIKNEIGIKSMSNFVSLAKVCSRFEILNNEANPQVPFITARISKEYNFPINIKMIKIDFHSHNEKITSHYRMPFSQEKKFCHRYDNNFNKTFIKIKKIEYVIPKKLKSIIQITVVEDMFTKELQNYYHIKRSENIAIPNGELCEIYHRSPPLIIFFSQVCEMHKNVCHALIINCDDYVTDGITNREVLKPKMKSENKILFKFLSAEAILMLFEEICQITQPHKKKRLKYPKLVKLNTTRIKFFQLKRFIVKQCPNKAIYIKSKEKSEKVVKIEETSGSPKQTQSNSGISINISMYRDGEPNLVELSTDSCSSQCAVKSPTKYSKLEIPDCYPASEKLLNNYKYSKIQKTLSYSVSKHIYSKYRNEIKKLRHLIADPLLQATRIMERKTITNITNLAYDVNKSNTYNDWLLTSFPLGMAKSAKDILSKFNYKFSFYIPENEKCHILFLEFFNIKSTQMTKSQFHQWCIEKCQYNTSELYDKLASLQSYENLRSEIHEDQEHILRLIARRCDCFVTISDRFVYENYGKFRAIQFVADDKKSVLLCIRYFMNNK